MSAAASTTLSIPNTQTAFVAATADFDAGFESVQHELYLTSASVVAFSYDGKNDHGRLDSSNLKSTLRTRKQRRVWFRYVSGTAPATLVASAWM